MGAPFARALAMVALIASGISRAEIAALGPYQSQGKNKTRSHGRGGSAAYQRAAKKARNVVRHKRNCRG